MVNEVQEILQAFVQRQDARSQHYIVDTYDDSVLVRTIGTKPQDTDLVLFHQSETSLGLFIEEACRHQRLRQQLVDAISAIIGPPPEPKPDHTNSIIEWGGPLTWLALKAALTTGGNDEP